MVKTQIQIPDVLYYEAKRIAQEYEMSFAEVVRRGLERVIPVYPKRTKMDREWQLPEIDAQLCVPLDKLRMIAASQEDIRSIN
jgi:hypothetical protein